MTVYPSAEVEPYYTATLPRVPESARRARSLVTAALGRWGLEEFEDAACLVTTELVANAAAHARSDSLLVRVERIGPRAVRVAVVDRSKVLPCPRDAGPDEESGRGLWLVDALSGGRWGADPLKWGKRVWAVLGGAA
ncbi:ATP-binding protein [Streptomyces sp. 2P-4]|uniref:ATP-binding protein n=1 Tax=Streptomyces sp. 2P-4 TaxID=2931974 RepID=UPI0025405A69|nr:ATP-binding protein [Streptomyces sp. 2P-4]